MVVRFMCKIWHFDSNRKLIFSINFAVTLDDGFLHNTGPNIGVCKVHVFVERLNGLRWDELGWGTIKKDFY